MQEIAEKAAEIPKENEKQKEETNVDSLDPPTFRPKTPSTPKPLETLRDTISETPKMPQSKTVLDHHHHNLKGIMLEHCYARPYNWRPESNFLRPTKTLFISQTVTKKKNMGAAKEEEEIDVETVAPEAQVIYDIAKAKKLMDECERFAMYARNDENVEDWEHKISRTNWTPSQNHLFNIMVNILNSDQMSRLGYVGVHNEPILRRTVVEKSVKRFRQLMAKYSWDIKLAQWLHQLLVDNLSVPYLAAYFDILQTLKHKLPMIVEKILFNSNAQTKTGPTSAEGLFPLLKRVWDPVAASLNQDKPKKLPGNPIIIIVPGAPSTSATMYSKRLHRWINLFSNLATVCTVYNNIGANNNKLTMTNCVDQMFAATRAKIQEIRTEFPNRPIVLAGFNAGSALALQVAQVETVLCVLCLGFSIHTAEGNRGEPDDSLLELQYPVLFVIGQCSNTALQEHMEDLRERMRVETGLLVVGSADDYLRISKKKKRSEGITQSVVDRCIVDELGEFISGLLLSPYPPQIRQSPAHLSADIMKRPKIERKRNNSNGSSLDSEPPSPTPRISRPGHCLSPVFGRPPGSKSKSKIEAKWHAMQQGIPSNIPPSPSSTLSPNTPDTSINDLIDPINESLKTTKTPQKSDKLGRPPLISSQNTAKLQAMGIQPGRSVYHGSALSNLLQGGGVRTLPPNPTGKQIKVLENLTISSSNPGKIMGMPGRSIDMSKMKVLNPSSGPNMMGNNYGSVMIMPDGKIKPSAQTMRGVNPPVIYPKGKTISSTNTISTTSIAKSSLTKYITSKKQLMPNKKVVKKLPYISTSTANLPPPTNLTSQDIMDLPIIFADDNQMLANNTMQPSDTPSMQILQSTQIKQQPPSTNSGKLVFLNKPAGYAQNILKRPAIPNTKNNPIKYAKIILSKAPTAEELKKIPNKMVVKESESSPVRMDIDLENELVATAITKPNFVAADSKNVSLIYKKAEMKLGGGIVNVSRKANEIEEDSDDPEYIPSNSDL